jgi:3-hydroxyisobutyrate dehydrogenase
MKIGFVGLGHMGTPMVLNLLKHQHAVKVYDVVPSAITKLAGHGATPTQSLAEVAKDVDVIITMLQTGEQVSDVCLSDDGLFANAKAETLFLECSSIDVTTARNLEEIAKGRHFTMLDAPVSGGVSGAEKATLTFMVGGRESVFNRAKPIFECMGKAIIHAGPSGTGQAAKICNNMILGISMIAISEAFVLGDKLGLSPEKLFEISSQASGQCWSMTSYCPVPGLVPASPSNRDYQPGFTAAMMLKDLRLSQQMAQTVNAATPLGAEATAVYSLFNNLGFDQLDFSAIIQLFAGENLGPIKLKQR